VTLLTRYTLRQIWIPALMAAVVISFVVLLGTIGEEVQNLLDKLPVAQLTVLDISRISLYSLPSLAGLIVPVTFLLGIMMAFGRMAQTSELTAAKAAGIPLRRLVLPIVATGAAVSAASFFLLDQAQPWAFQRLSYLIGSELPLRVTLDTVPTGVMHEYGGWRVYIGSRDADRTLHNVIVLQERGQNIHAHYAKSARVIDENGVARLEMKDVWPIQENQMTVNVESSRITLPRLQTFEREGQRQGWTLARLLHEEGMLRETAKAGNKVIKVELAKVRSEIGDRLAFPLMCLAVSVVAAPVGARARRSGRSFTFSSGLIIVVAYFVLRAMLNGVLGNVAEAAITKGGALPSLNTVVLFSQVPNLALIFVGLLFLWRVDRV
jgi:lipopolysaccharide export system permease protein